MDPRFMLQDHQGVCCWDSQRKIVPPPWWQEGEGSWCLSSIRLKGLQVKPSCTCSSKGWRYASRFDNCHKVKRGWSILGFAGKDQGFKHDTGCYRKTVNGMQQCLCQKVFMKGRMCSKWKDVNADMKSAFRAAGWQFQWPWSATVSTVGDR